jgi:hypothetical protein
VHGSFPSFLASWAVMTATMLPTAVPAAARYAQGRVAAGLSFALSYLAVWGFAGIAVFVLCGPHGALAPGATTIAARNLRAEPAQAVLPPALPGEHRLRAGRRVRLRRLVPGADARRDGTGRH